MSQKLTDPKVFDEVMNFASEIRMIGLPLHKEKNGYFSGYESYFHSYALGGSGRDAGVLRK